MPGTTASRAAALVALFSLVGLAVSVFLTWDHLVFRLDPAAVSGLCAPGSGCEISRTSPWSEVSLGRARPGLPISLAGGAFYVGLLLLAWRRRRRPQDAAVPRLLVGLSAGAVVLSAFLAWVSIRAQGKLCPWCTVLYVVNAALLVTSLATFGEPLRRLLSGLDRALLSHSALVFTTAVVAVTSIGWFAYSRPIQPLYDARQNQLQTTAETLGDAPVVRLDNRDRPALGRADARVTVVEFADFACPHCGRLYDTLHELQTERPGDIRVVFRHFPLSTTCNPLVKRDVHPNACLLAAAADCAYRQKRFDDAAAWLFREARGADRAALVAGLGSLGLDEAALDACLDDDTVTDRIRDDIIAAGDAGVRGTPTFFVGGRRVEGARSRDILETMVDSVLAHGDATDGTSSED